MCTVKLVDMRKRTANGLAHILIPAPETLVNSMSKLLPDHHCDALLAGCLHLS